MEEIKFEDNLNLVYWSCRKYFKNFYYEDLIQEGSIGLIEAIEKYKGDKLKYKFSTFAILHIKRKIWRFLEENKEHLQVPAHLGGIIVKSYKGKELNKNEGKRLELFLTVLPRLKKKCLEKIFSFDEEYELKRIDFYSKVETIKKERSKEILKLYLQGYNLQEIGKIYKISRERVRQIKEDTLKELKV